MAWRREVRLTEEQRGQLTWMVKHDPKAYRRERAAAILKVADGAIASQVAASGLLVPRDPDTVYEWLGRFEEVGVEGLTIAGGRGRKPTHSPPLGRASRRRSGPGCWGCWHVIRARGRCRSRTRAGR